MKKTIVIFLFLYINLSAYSFFIENIPYKVDDHNKGFNFIIFLNQLPVDLSQQHVLNLLKNKNIVDSYPNTFKSTLMALYKENYQIFISTYQHKNELLSPNFSMIHQYKKYNIRQNNKKLNSERQILKNTFEAMDEFVYKNKDHYRPICLVIILPPKLIYSLELDPQGLRSTFNRRRDFSLINLYHEIHKRRYLYPNKVLVYNNQYSSKAFLINNR